MVTDDIDRDLQTLEADLDLDPIVRFERLKDILWKLKPEDPRHPALLGEWAAWALQPDIDASTSVKGGRWFGPLAVLGRKDGTQVESPDPSLFTPDVFTHLANRAMTTTNPEVAARFADVLWDRRAGDHTHARQAFEKYAYLARRRVGRPDASDGQNPTLIVTYAKRATTLALQLRDGHLLEEAAGLYRELLTPAPATTLGPGSLLQLILDGIPLMQRGKLAPEDLLDPADRLCTCAAEGDTKNLICDAIAKIHSTLGHHDDARAWRLKRAESLEQHGDFFMRVPEAAMIALAWYKNAAAAYAQIGAGKDRIESIKKKMAQAGAGSLHNMKEISVSIEIPREDVDPVITRVTSMSMPDAIKTLISAGWGIPKVEQVRSSTLDMRKRSVVASLATRVVVDDDGLSHELSAEEAEKCDLVRHILSNYLIIHDLLVGPILETLRKTRGMSADDIIGTLASLGTIADGRLALIRSGVEAYLRGDHVAAIHVLVPQVEGLVRDFADALEVSTTSLHDDGAWLIPQSLDMLLADPQLRGAFSEDFAVLLEAIYTHPLGMRLRHRVAHGNIKNPATFTSRLAETVLWTTLQLAKFKATPKASGDAL